MLKPSSKPRIPRKKGQPARSKKHSDLYTDENPKGTIKGLKFATKEDAVKSISKIRNSGRSKAHKIQAAIAMEQRARVMGKKDDTIDLLEHVIRTGTGSSQQDLSITRISVSTYATIPNKNATGRPIQVYIDRRSGATTSSGSVPPQINVYPAPDTSETYTFVYWRLKRIDDAGNGVNTQAIPFRFYNCLIAGLAYYLSVKIPGAEGRIGPLKQDYEEQWNLASEEDREKASIRVVPTSSFSAR
jgi:hypothetical protein